MHCFHDPIFRHIQRRRKLVNWLGTKPQHLEGESFVPLLRNPQLKRKAAVIGRFKTGDTIRTDLFPFSEYTTPAGEQNSRMLEGHQQDPEENYFTFG